MCTGNAIAYKEKFNITCAKGNISKRMRCWTTYSSTLNGIG